MSSASSRRVWSAVAPPLLLLASTFAAASASGSAPPDPALEPVSGEVSLERRLFAPCCWTQTLDAHESELASSLRREIRTRLRAGEPATAIEDALAARYGERIRAVERGRDPGGAMPFFVGTGALLAGGALIAMLRRWRRAAVREGVKADITEAGARRVTTALDPYESRLDAELRELDE